MDEHLKACLETMKNGLLREFWEWGAPSGFAPGGEPLAQCHLLSSVIQPKTP